MFNEVKFDQINEAYIKLKSHIYYDSTELFQRIKLAEFEALKQNATLIPIKHEVKNIEDNVNAKLNVHCLPINWTIIQWRKFA